MQIHRAFVLLAALVLPPWIASSASAAELKLLEGNVFKAAMDELGPQFEKATGNKLVATIGTTAQLRALVEKGEVFDVALFTKSALDDLAKQGKIADTPRLVISRVGIGVAVRRGAARPDVSTTEAFKHVMLNAASIGYVKQTPTAASMKVIFERLGIAEQVQSKIKQLDVVVPEALAKREVEIGLTQISEIIPNPAVELAGPLPADIQVNTVFGAGIAPATKNRDAAVALVNFLTTPAAGAVLKAKGMEPN